MKALYLFIWICCLQQHYLRADNTSPPDLSLLTVACVSVPELLTATASACMQRNNATLWKQIIDCHAPMTEKFLRDSAEARCAVNKFVQDPSDRSFSIRDVFLNVCSLLDETNLDDKNRGLNCLINGNHCPKIMSHEEEVREVRRRFGAKVPCNIGLCVKSLGIA